MNENLTKVCKNCDHYRVTKFLRTKVCTAPAKWQRSDFLVTGKLMYAAECKVARNHESKCGQDARCFATPVTVP